LIVNRHTILLFVGVLFALSACTPCGLREACGVVKQADSLRAEGQQYEDSASLAEAYNTLGCWRWIYADEYAHACYYYGRWLRSKDQPIAAMQVFVRATQSATRDYAILGRIYSNMANMCRQAERHDVAYDVYTLSAVQFAKAGDTLAYAYALNNMAWEQAVQGKKAEAVALVDSAVAVCPRSEVKEKVKESLAAACLYVGEHDSTLYYTEQMNSVYGRMLRTQAYCLKNQCDSAVDYSHKVVAETVNPRYLDDAYYILAYCDYINDVSQLLDITSARTDVQRDLEQEKVQKTQAIVLMQQGLNAKKSPLRRAVTILCCLLIAAILFAIGHGLFIRHRLNRVTRIQESQQEDREVELTKICQAIAHSKNLRGELHWDDYESFCTTCNARFYGLVDKLLQRGLIEREVRISLLVLIGLSYAEMADILNRAQNGIGKDKYVIAKKLGVTVKDLQSALLHIACQNG